MSRTVPAPEQESRASSGSATARSIEARSIDFVPESERHGSIRRQAVFWFVPNATIFSVSLGLIGPGLGLTLGWSVVAGAVGAVFGGLFVAFHASQGPRLGLPQMIQSRAQFGYRGVVVPTSVVLINFLVFNVLQTDVLKSGLSSILGWQPSAVIVGVSLAAALLAIFGHDWLHRAYRVLFWCFVPFLLVVSVGIAVGAAGEGAPVAAQRLGFDLAAFVTVVAAATAYQLALAPYVSDYTRYLPSTVPTSRVVVVVQVGVCVSLVWLMSIGAWLAATLGATDAIVGLNEAGNAVLPHLGSVTTVLAILALVAVIGTNTYSAGLAVITMVDCLRPVEPTRRLRVMATVGLLLVWGTVNLALDVDQAVLISNLLNVLLYLLAPWSAVNLVDFFLVRRGHYAVTEIVRRGGLYGDWAWRGLVAYAAGLLVEVPFVSLSFFQGPLQRLIGVDVSFVLGLLVAGGAYLLLSRSLRLASEADAVARSRSDLGQR